MRLHTQTFKVNDTVVYVDLWQWRTDKVKIRLSVRYAVGEEKKSTDLTIEVPGVIKSRRDYKTWLQAITIAPTKDKLIRNAQKALKEIL